MDEKVKKLKDLLKIAEPRDPEVGEGFCEHCNSDNVVVTYEHNWMCIATRWTCKNCYAQTIGVEMEKPEPELPIDEKKSSVLSKIGSYFRK